MIIKFNVKILFNISWILVLAHWNNSLWIDTCFHSDTLSWLKANQFLLFLLNAVCLAEKQQIQIKVFDVIYRTQDELANYYTIDAVFSLFVTSNYKKYNHDVTKTLLKH